MTWIEIVEEKSLVGHPYPTCTLWVKELKVEVLFKYRLEFVENLDFKFLNLKLIKSP